MTYTKCDRCGARINSLDNQSNITVMANYEVPVANARVSLDLCETCTKQFYSHFMKNHYHYKEYEHETSNQTEN